MRGRSIFFACDVENCDTPEFESSTGWTTFKELTAMAREAGWSIGQEHDYCPAHRLLARVKDPRRRAEISARNQFVDRSEGIGGTYIPASL